MQQHKVTLKLSAEETINNILIAATNDPDIVPAEWLHIFKTNFSIYSNTTEFKMQYAKLNKYLQQKDWNIYKHNNDEPTQDEINEKNWDLGTELFSFACPVIEHCLSFVPQDQLDYLELQDNLIELCNNPEIKYLQVGAASMWDPVKARMARLFK